MESDAARRFPRRLASLRAAVEGPVLRAVLQLPRPVLRALAGRPVTRDGQTLDVEMQLVLRLQKLLREPPAETLPLPKARRAIERQSALVGGRQPIGDVVDRAIDGPAGPLTLRSYAPTAVTSARGPALVFFHGGGWMYGSLDSHDAVCRFLAQQATATVVAVDYRLAPEHPFPAAVEDCIAAYSWVADSSDVLGIDPARIAVGGDSAGGNLATVVAAEARGLPQPPAFQLLLYPGTDMVREHPSRRMFAGGFYLTSGFIALANSSYVPGGSDAEDPRVSPLHLSDVSGMCPAYIATAGFDPLRDEGEAYADLLAAAGVPLQLKRFPGLIHGFVNMVGIGRSAPAAMAEVAAALRAGLA